MACVAANESFRCRENCRIPVRRCCPLTVLPASLNLELRILYSKSENVHVDLLLYLVKIKVLLFAESFVRVWVIDDGEVLVQQLYGEYISMLHLLCVNEFYCIFLKCLSSTPKMFPRTSRDSPFRLKKTKITSVKVLFNLCLCTERSFTRV